MCSVTPRTEWKLRYTVETEEDLTSWTDVRVNSPHLNTYPFHPCRTTSVFFPEPWTETLVGTGKSETPNLATPLVYCLLLVSPPCSLGVK